MHKLLLRIRLRLRAVADIQCARLVIGAVRAGHKLLVLSLEWEPRLQIKLFGRSVVQSTRNNGNDLVRKSQRLVELLRHGNHFFKRFPRLLGVRQQELLNLSSKISIKPNMIILACKPSQTGALGKFPRHRDRANQLHVGSRCCILHICTKVALVHCACKNKRI